MARSSVDIALENDIAAFMATSPLVRCTSRETASLIFEAGWLAASRRNLNDQFARLNQRAAGLTVTETKE